MTTPTKTEVTLSQTDRQLLRDIRDALVALGPTATTPEPGQPVRLTEVSERVIDRVFGDDFAADLESYGQPNWGRAGEG